VLPKEVVSLLQHLRDSDDLGVTMEVIVGGVVILLCMAIPCGRGMLPSGPWP
jgi:hypothetical protein